MTTPFAPWLHPIAEKSTQLTTPPWVLFFQQWLANTVGLVVPAGTLRGRGTSSDGEVEAITVGDGLQMIDTVLSVVPAVPGTIPAAIKVAGLTVDGGGTAITTGVKGYLFLPVDGVITAATLLADQVGDVVIDVWRSTYGTFPPTSGQSITGGTPPTLVGSASSHDVSLMRWTRDVSAGDVLGFSVLSATTVTRVTLELTVAV